MEAAQVGFASSGLSADDEQTINARRVALWEAVEREPKSLRWKSRARIGERARRYEEPEEIAHGKVEG